MGLSLWNPQASINFLRHLILAEKHAAVAVNTQKLTWLLSGFNSLHLLLSCNYIFKVTSKDNLKVLYTRLLLHWKTLANC